MSVIHDHPSQAISYLKALDESSQIPPELEPWSNYCDAEGLTHLTPWPEGTIGVVRELTKKGQAALLVNAERPTKRRTGRPRRGESDKDSLVLAALAKHHGWQAGGGGSIKNWDPAKTKH